MEIAELSPDEVATALENDRDSVYLDVRTEQEFEAGRPAGSWNIPMYQLHAATGQMVPNPEFLEVARAGLSPEQFIYCGCASGIRSLHAAMLLRQAGFLHVFNVDAGFTGKKDMIGRTLLPGWAERGHPVASGPDERLGYPALRAAALGAERAGRT